jgi:glutamate racemase
MIFDSRPIGIFDSGIGGLTILNELIKILPEERFVYLADTDHMPYGNKSSKTIIKYSLECASSLLEQNIKCLVVACHTASAYAFEELERQLPIPVIGMIQPSFTSLMQATKNLHVAILGTEGTIHSNIYQTLIRKNYPKATIFPIACPRLALLIEKGKIDDSYIQPLIKVYLRPLQNTCIDTALLACTHYPILRQIFQKELGKEVTLIDPAKACAQAVKNQLKIHSYFCQ